MPEILFPEKWWKLSPEEYNESKLALKGLIAKDPDSGNAEVIMFRESKEDEERILEVVFSKKIFSN